MTWDDYTRTLPASIQDFLASLAVAVPGVQPTQAGPATDSFTLVWEADRHYAVLTVDLRPDGMADGFLRNRETGEWSGVDNVQVGHLWSWLVPAIWKIRPDRRRHLPDSPDHDSHGVWWSLVDTDDRLYRSLAADVRARADRVLGCWPSDYQGAPCPRCANPR